MANVKKIKRTKPKHLGVLRYRLSRPKIEINPHEKTVALPVVRGEEKPWHTWTKLDAPVMNIRLHSLNASQSHSRTLPGVPNKQNNIIPILTRWHSKRKTDEISLSYSNLQFNAIVGYEWSVVNTNFSSTQRPTLFTCVSHSLVNCARYRESRETEVLNLKQRCCQAPHDSTLL